MPSDGQGPNGCDDLLATSMRQVLKAAGKESAESMAQHSIDVQAGIQEAQKGG